MESVEVSGIPPIKSWAGGNELAWKSLIKLTYVWNDKLCMDW